MAPATGQKHACASLQGNTLQGWDYRNSVPFQWRLSLHEEQVLKSPGDVCGSVFQPGECVAQRKWIILAGSPADDFPNESAEDASFPLQGNMTWD